MTNLLENSNLALCLVLWCDSDLPKSTLLGESLYDLDGNELPILLEVACLLDLTVYASAQLSDDLVIVDDLATGYDILFDLCFMCSGKMRLAMSMT